MADVAKMSDAELYAERARLEAEREALRDRARAVEREIARREGAAEAARRAGFEQRIG